MAMPREPPSITLHSESSCETRPRDSAIRLSFALPYRQAEGSLMASHKSENALSDPPKQASRGQTITDHFLVGRWHRRPVCYVYILRCADNSLYIGETHDVVSRSARHNDGVGAADTAKRRPVRVVYTEQYETRKACLRRERQLKGWTRAKKEALIADDKSALKRL